MLRKVSVIMVEAMLMIMRMFVVMRVRILTFWPRALDHHVGTNDLELFVQP